VVTSGTLPAIVPALPKRSTPREESPEARYGRSQAIRAPSKVDRNTTPRQKPPEAWVVFALPRRRSDGRVGRRSVGIFTDSARATEAANKAIKDGLKAVMIEKCRINEWMLPPAEASLSPLVEAP